MSEIEVPMGELVVSENTDTLITTAVGSCLVITFYDTRFKNGGMAHAMLSKAPINQAGMKPDARYVDIAIDKMLRKMETQGSKRQDLEAKLIGGANMFPLTNSDIGSDNVISARKKLKEEGIPLVGECTGGSMGRSVEFSATTGIVTVKTIF